MAGCHIPFCVTLTSDLISWFLASGAYSDITNNFPQICLMLDQFHWGIGQGTVTFLVQIMPLVPKTALSLGSHVLHYAYIR